MNLSVMDFGQPALFWLRRPALLYPLLASMTVTSYGAFCADRSAHIEVVKATLFESSAGVSPQEIVRTRDDGFVVAGSLGPAQAWAARINSNNREVWRYVVPTGSGQHQIMKSKYVGVVQLPDDSTLLCGAAISITDGVPSEHKVGLLTVISKHGQVTAETLLEPPSGTSFRGDAIWQCIPYGDGALTVATASRPIEGQVLGTLYVRMLTLDSQGRRVADHLFPAVNGLNDVASFGTEIVLLCNGSVRESGATAVQTTRLLRLDDAGTTTVARTFRGAGYYLRDVDNILSIALLLAPDGATQVRTLGAELEDVAVVNGPPQPIYLSTRSYRLKDGSIVFFGRTEVGTNSYSDSVTWLDSKLHNKEVFMFAPLFTSDKVHAVTASGRPGEFVTARGVHPRGIPGSETDPTGLMLTVLKVR